MCHGHQYTAFVPKKWEPLYEAPQALGRRSSRSSTVLFRGACGFSSGSGGKKRPGTARVHALFSASLSARERRLSSSICARAALTSASWSSNSGDSPMSLASSARGSRFSSFLLSVMGDSSAAQYSVDGNRSQSASKSLYLTDVRFNVVHRLLRRVGKKCEALQTFDSVVVEICKKSLSLHCIELLLETVIETVDVEKHDWLIVCAMSLMSQHFGRLVERANAPRQHRECIGAREHNFFTLA